MLSIFFFIAAAENPLKNPVWIAMFFTAVFTIAFFLKTFPGSHKYFLWGMVFWMCHIKKPFYMELFFEPYRGVDRGFGITICDFFFFGYFVFLLLTPEKIKKIWPINTFVMFLLIACSFMSLTNSIKPYYSLFTIHKMFRGIVLYWVTINILNRKKDFQIAISALAFSIIFQGSIVFIDKYVTKSVVVRSVGTFPHPNSLAMYVNLVLPVLLCLILVTDVKKERSIYSFALLMGMVCVVFTKSRGGLIIMLASLMMAAGISILLKITLKKIGILFLGFIVICILGAIAAPKIIQRFQSAPKESAETRHYFNDAAKAMADQHFWGIGINSYSQTLANTEYYWYVYPDVEEEDREDFRDEDNPRAGSRLGNCHHIYLLWASECGWLSMYIFLWMISWFYLLNGILIWKTRKAPFYNAIVIGLLCGFTTLHLQGLLEWVYRQTQVYYLFHFLSGMLIRIYINKENLLEENLLEKPSLENNTIPNKAPTEDVLLRKHKYKISKLKRKCHECSKDKKI